MRRHKIEIFGKILICMCLCFWVSLPRAAQSQACHVTPEAQKVLAQINLGAKLSPSPRLCPNGTHAETVLDTLVSMYDLRLQPDKAPANGEIITDGFWDYFTARIHVIEDAPPADPVCKKKTTAYVLIGTGDQTMHVCPFFYDPQMTVYNRIQVLLHEARHTEGFPHVDCQQGNNAGHPASCDQNLKERGSYGVSVESLLKMAKVDRVLEVDKQLNRLGALMYMENSFNDVDSAIMLRDLQGKNFVYDGLELLPAPPTIATASVISLGDRLEIYPNETANPGSNPAFVVDSLTFSPLSLREAGTKYYNEQQTGQIPTSIWNGQLLAVLQERQLSTLDPSHPKNGFTAIDLGFTGMNVYFGPELGLQGSSSLFVQTVDDRMFQVDASTVHEIQNPIRGLNNAVIFNHSRLALTNDGRLVRLVVDGKSAKWTAVPDLAGHRFKSLSRAFAWSPVLYGVSVP